MHARCTCILFYSKNVIYSNSACMTKSSFVTGKMCTLECLKLLLIAMLITGHNN